MTVRPDFRSCYGYHQYKKEREKESENDSERISCRGEKDRKTKLLILLIAPIAVIVDQITKSLVVHFIPLGGSLWEAPRESLFRIIHVRNTAIAFGLGRGFADELKVVLFILLPLVIVISLIIYSLYKNDQPLYQRVAFALIIGGGTGNLIDRIFRPGNVVDFVDTIWFGIDALRNVPILKLLSYERWPTWNIADACVVVAVAILLVGMIIEEVQAKKRKKN